MRGDNLHFKACSHAKEEERNKKKTQQLLLIHTAKRESGI